MDIQQLYYDSILVTMEWVDCPIFLASCAWLLSSVEILGIPKSEKRFFPIHSRVCLSIMLLCVAGLNGVLLAGLNLFPVLGESVIPILLGFLGLGGFVAGCCLLLHLVTERDWKQSEWLVYAVLAGLLAAWLFELRSEDLGHRRHADRWIIPAACLCALVALIVLIRVMARSHFRFKEVSSLWEISSIVLIFALSIIWLRQETFFFSKRYFERLVSIVSLAAHTLPKQKILQLRGIPEDVRTANYEEVRTSLENIINDFPVIRFAYLWTINDGRLIFIADGSKTDVSLPGDVFRRAEPQDNRFLTKSTPYALTPFRDPWGVWVSANYPIPNLATGQNFCWLGIDIPAENYFSYMGRPRLQIMSLTSLLLMVLGLYRSTGRRNKAEIDFERQSQMIRESERRKIAGQLHDDLGQLITAIGFEATTLRHLATNLSEAADSTLQRLQALVEKAGLRSRDQAFGLSPYLANPARFSQELRRFVLDLGVLLRLGVVLDLPPEPLACVSAEVATDLIHIVQESFTNAAKHGSRQKVHLSLTREKRTWLLLIENEESHPISATTEVRPGIGLRIMEARVADMGGKFFFRHFSDGRAQVSCEFPLSIFTEQPE